ncbi:SufD family Fe-S cluster assembly protein [Streptomyces scabiei]|uniref:SufD family Fe-S cluster assembly protein n=1 Tax=Streptomyces scabiei TaxID=1930 RepID=UPI001B33EF9A|nr:SufD family Fe-S cluster assembly protein [Streptomyces sp. LBUM 1488]MBP5897910.1 SufD family Fe-S cluster assembly protein [Streptomyces sp. LBUM 1488]
MTSLTEAAPHIRSLVAMKEHADDGWSIAASIGAEPSMYFPEQDGKAVPEEGAWIIVVEEPMTELRSRFRVPELSMWRARPHQLNSGAITVGHGKQAAKVYPKQAVIATPRGDLHLWPHEYVVADRPMELASDPEATLNSLGGEPVLDEEELFYLMSRGIQRHEAVMLLFDKVTSLDFVYVTFPKEVTDVLAGAGQSLRRHMALKPRA